MQPTEEEIQRWQEIAKRRNAILPLQFQILGRKEVNLVCGQCRTSFTRALIVARNDPIYVCPNCASRNYIPIDWNIIRFVRKNY